MPTDVSPPAAAVTAASGANTEAAPGVPRGKRGRTRKAIADAAFALFAERGFDAVRLTDIAAAADVAPATVFNHFASKEDIFFHRRDEFDAALPEAVARAQDAAGLVVALREFYTANGELLVSGDTIDASRTFARILLGSDALRRNYLPLQHHRKAMVVTLVEERWPHTDDGDLRMLAAFAVGAGTTAFEALHAGLAAGGPVDAVRARFRADVGRGFERVAAAFGDFALRA